jgi:hypothetical protein
VSLVSLVSRLRANVRTITSAVAVVTAVVAVASGGACTSTSTTLLYTPITGLIIRSESLVAGHGCGTANGGLDQIYRYAAVLTVAPQDGGGTAAPTSKPFTPLWNVFDCFADGVFENLQTDDGATFALTIYAYTAAAYARSGLPVRLGCAADSVDDASCPAVPTTLTTQLAYATWTTTCIGTQQAGAPVVATCGPLERVAGMVGPPPDASIDDAGDAGPSAPDASVDANVDANSPPDSGASDASDAGTSPADADSTPNDAAGSGG